MAQTEDQTIVTATNLSAVVSICAIICLVLSTLSVAGRLFTKARVIHRLTIDDHTIFVATVLSVGQCVSICLSSTHGLGRPWQGLNKAQRDAVQKTLYASELLFVLTIILIKLSIAIFFRGLAPIRASKRVGAGVVVFLVLWATASFLAVAFRCEIPAVWQQSGHSCVDIRALRISFGVINILTEVVLIAWPVAIIMRLHASQKRRLLFVMAFACRILVIIACATQLTYTVDAGNSGDLTFDLWPMAICMQVVQCVSLITACIPYLQPFMLSLESGFLWGEDFRQRRLKDSAYASDEPSKPTSRNYLPDSNSSRDRSEAVGDAPSAESEQPGITHPQNIAILPMPVAGEPLRTPIGLSWDNQSGSGQLGLTDFSTRASTAVDTRRRQLEGY